MSLLFSFSFDGLAERSSDMCAARIGMAFLHLLMLLRNTLFFIVVANLCTNHPVSCIENRDFLWKSLTPKHYDIKLMPDVENGVFIGECNATFVLEDTKQIIGFHSKNLTILKVSLQDLQVSEENIVAVHEPIQRLDVDSFEGIVILHFIQALSPGKYVLKTKFSGTLTDKDGFFRTSCINSARKKTWMVATHTQTGDAPKVFPCWNNPYIKTNFTISVRHRATQMALSNMPIRENSEENKLTMTSSNELVDLVWTHFRTTPAISTYSVAVAVLPKFVSKRNPLYDNVVMWSRIHSATHMSFASDIAGKVARYLEDEQRLNSSLKVPEVNHVAIHGLLPFKIIATLGLIIYREEDIMYRNESSVAQKYNVARLVAHQVAYQWIILFSSPLRWFSSWVYGAADFFGIYALEKAIPDTKIMNLFVIQTQHESLHLDVNLMEPIESNTYTAASTHLFPSYAKVSAILRMLQNILTEDVFWKSVQNSLKEGTFSPSHFMEYSAVTEVKLSDHILLSDHIDNPVTTISGIMSVIQYIYYIMPGWLNNKHYPLVKSHVSPHAGLHENTYYISQDSFIRGGHNVGYFIPFTYTEENNIDFEKSWPERSESAWLRSDLSFPFIVSKKSNWFICNVQQIGYYRVNYQKDNWDNIANYLRTSNHKKIHVLNRAQIIDDFYHLMKEKHQFVFKMTFENLIQYLSIETDYEAWYPMFRILEDFSGSIPYPSTWFEGIKRFLLNIVNGLLRNITFQVDPDEHEFRTCLRQDAIKWACFLGDSKCVEMVTARLTMSLIQSKRNDSAPLPMWEEWMYCTGLQTGDKYIWDRLLSIYNSIRHPAILKALPCIYVIYEDGKRFLNNSKKFDNGTDSLDDSERLQRLTFENGNFTDFFAYLRDTLRLKVNEEVILFRSLIAKLGRNLHALRQIVNNLEKIKPRKMTVNAALCIVINHIYVSNKTETITQFSAFIKRELRKHENTLYGGNVNLYNLIQTLTIKERELKNLETAIVTHKINLRYSQMKKYIENMTVFFETPIPTEIDNTATDPYLML